MDPDIYDPDYVAALFDRCSARYRWWSAVSSFGMVSMWRRRAALRLLGARQVARIAGDAARAEPVVYDLMAGTGEVWPHLLRHLGPVKIVAIDISERMHSEAVGRLHAQNADRITHISANVLTHDLPQDGADMVVSTFGLKTFSVDQQRVLAQQIAMALRPGGCFCLIEASDPKGWVLRPLYRLYLDRILPLVERVFLKGAQDFSMIGTYTRGFGNCSAFEAALRDQGLIVGQQRHFFGCATSVAGHKPVASDPDAA